MRTAKREFGVNVTLFFEVNGQEIKGDVRGIYIPFSKGSRDRWGAPEEEDCGDEFEYYDMLLNGIKYNIEPAAELLGMSVEELDEKIEYKMREELENY